MAQKVSVTLVSDLSGDEIKDGKGETVTYSLDGVTYEVDLTSKEADKFRGLFQDHIAVSRKVGGRRGRKSSGSTGSGSDAKAIRAWAKDQGIDVPERGRIPAELREQYDASH
jgi:hypothetical protein